MLPENQALLIKPCSSIHTWFMKYPLDIIFLNQENRVIRILHTIPPYRFGPVVRNAKTVLELTAGRCRQTGTEKGDLICFQ